MDDDLPEDSLLDLIGMPARESATVRCGHTWQRQVVRDAAHIVAAALEACWLLDGVASDATTVWRQDATARRVRVSPDGDLRETGTS
jgi:hypothetical protein